MTLTEWLEKNQALCEKATRGPWHVSRNRHPDLDGSSWGAVEARRHPAGGAGDYPDGMGITWKGEKGRDNADFIATSRLSLPTALKIIRAIIETTEKESTVNTREVNLIAESIIREETKP